jgi:hypothetical protein
MSKEIKQAGLEPTDLWSSCDWAYWDYLVQYIENYKILFKSLKVKNVPMKKLRGAKPWVDVMITIFCDFSRNFRQKKLAFFTNTNVIINFFQNLALFWVKNANFFAKFFGENI